MKYFHSSQYPIEFVLSENINKDFSFHNHANHYIISLCIKGSITATLKNKFHLQNRIRKAQTLLFTNKSVTEASVDTGFYDQSHFNRAFKSIVEISPTEYLASSKTI